MEWKEKHLTANQIWVQLGGWSQVQPRPANNQWKLRCMRVMIIVFFGFLFVCFIFFNFILFLNFI